MFLIHRPMETASRLSRVFDEALRGWPFTADDGSLVGAWIPPVDVLEEKDAVKIVAELPGVRPEDVKISLENGVLTIRGEKRQVQQESTERVRRWERTYGVFERSFTVPNTVEADSVRAQYDNGVLTITLPKAERAKPREISVEVARA